MDELEILKKDWKKNENAFDQVTEKEIYGMLHKRSSSIVKWILIISMLEFIIINGIGFLVGGKEADKFAKLHPYLYMLEIFNYFILLGFIFLFYKNYKTICVLDSSKKLINDIIKTRKIVNYYIYWNIFISSFFGIFALIDSLDANENLELSKANYIIIFIFSMILIIGLVFLFYKLLYGILLRKLNKNYKELLKMEY